MLRNKITVCLFVQFHTLATRDGLKKRLEKKMIDPRPVCILIAFALLVGCDAQDGVETQTDDLSVPSSDENSREFSSDTSKATDEQLPSSRVTAAQLIAAGEETSKRLAPGSFRWVARHELPAAQAEIEILHTPEMRRISVDFIIGQNQSKLVTIIERDGFWYCTEHKTRTKYKPYEAVLQIPAIYHLLARSEIRVVTSADAEQIEETIAEVDGDVVTMVTPLTDAMRSQFERIVMGTAQLPADKVPPQQKTQIAEIKRILERGLEMKVSRDTGIVLQNGAVGKRTWIVDFEPIEQPDAASFSVEDHEWEDHTLPLSTDNMTDVMMISHVKSWRPGSPKQDTDLCLLNINTGKLRRVPFQLGLATMGCFSPQRNSVFVSGHVPDEGYIGLFEIDLSDGEHRQLGGTMLQRGFAMGATLSPDGKTLATCQMGTNQEVLSFQVVIVDVESGEAKAIGDPQDIAFLNWLPDGSGLIAALRESRGPDKPPHSTICRLDLDGTITPIRDGGRPVLVNAPKPSILFHQNTEDGSIVKICDLDGRNERQLGDGFSRHGFACVSPDGKRIAMMKFSKQIGPRPVIIDIDTGKSTAIAVGAGMWTLPRWK